jgi:hypothetical protein
MARRYLLCYLFFVLIFGGIFPIGVVYAVDPMQVFRKASYLPIFSTNERYQIPGLIRNYDYDTVIVGTSMAQNFYTDYVNRKLGAHVLKIAISGSSAHEQFLVLSLALRTGKVRRVIWGIDQWVFRGSPERVRDDLGAFPYYLYATNALGYFWYLFNGSNFLESVLIITEPARFMTSHSPEVPNDWNTFDRYYRYSHVNAIRDYFNLKNSEGLDDPVTLLAYDLDVMRRSFEKNTAALIRCYPDVVFDVYFPPYSILNGKFYAVHFPFLFDRLIDFQNIVMKELVGLPNVRLFDFSDVSWVTHDLDLYKDMGHFKASINEFIVDSIASDQHRVNPHDPEASTRRLRQQVESYAAPSTADETALSTGQN